MNPQAVKLLQEIYTIVRDDSLAVSHQSMGQYRSSLLRELSARIKTAIGAEAGVPVQVQARPSGEGLSVEIGCLDENGGIQALKQLTTDEAHGLVKEIEHSISEVVTREFRNMAEHGR